MLGRRWLLFFAVLGSTASQKEGKKKAGKNKNNSTPPKRLNRLVKFSEEWLQTNIGNAENSSATKQFRENYVKRKVKQIKKVAQRFESVYSAKNPKTGELRCGYYDPTTTYGGPQEVPPKINDAKKVARKEYLESQRSRRHLIVDEFKFMSMSPQDWHHIRRAEDLNHIEEKILTLEKWFQDYFDNKQTIQMLDFEPDEDKHDIHRRAPAVNLDQGKMGTANTRYDKNDPVRGWKQITTGFRKWAERYTAYCRGEYVSKAFSKYATENLWRKTETAYRCRILGQDRQNCKPKKN